MRDKESNFREKNFLGAEQNILAVDLGTTTGWAIKNEYGITSGSMSFKPSRFEGGGMRYLHFQRWLGELPRVDVVYFEEVRRHLGVDAAHAYGGFLSHLTAWCEVKQIPYQGIPVGTIKRFMTGKGNANKLEVIEVIKALGYRPTDDNEADALGLLHLAMQKESSAKKKIHQEVKHEC
jgi:Holliday junction resolvasome RuvABC endonuclease subunit